MKKGKAIIFSAPSGSGKTTLVHEIMRRLPYPFAFSVSATTRPPRSHEKDGIDYFFLSIDEFQKKVKEQAFIEWEEIYPGIFYGTLKSEVERLWNEGKIILFDVDVKGAMNLKKYFSDKALTIFVKPPSLDVLRERLLQRGTETPESLQVRLEKASFELTFEPYFDVVILNDSLEKAVQNAIFHIGKFLQMGKNEKYA